MARKEKDLREITERLEEVSQETAELLKKVREQKGRVIAVVVMGFQSEDQRNLDVSVSLAQSRNVGTSLSHFVHLLEKAKNQIQDEIKSRSQH